MTTMHHTPDTRTHGPSSPQIRFDYRYPLDVYLCSALGYWAGKTASAAESRSSFVSSVRVHLTDADWRTL